MKTVHDHQARHFNEGDDMKAPHKWVDGHYMPLTDDEIAAQKATEAPEPKAAAAPESKKSK